MKVKNIKLGIRSVDTAFEEWAETFEKVRKGKKVDWGIIEAAVKLRDDLWVDGGDSQDLVIEKLRLALDSFESFK